MNVYFSILVNMFKNSQSKSNEKKLIDPANYHPKSPLDDLVIRDGKFIGVRNREAAKKVVKK